MAADSKFQKVLTMVYKIQITCFLDFVNRPVF
jgi:hypothetical protein